MKFIGHDDNAVHPLSLPVSQNALGLVEGRGRPSPKLGIVSQVAFSSIFIATSRANSKLLFRELKIPCSPSSNRSSKPKGIPVIPEPECFRALGWSCPERQTRAFAPLVAVRTSNKRAYPVSKGLRKKKDKGERQEAGIKKHLSPFLPAHSATRECPLDFDARSRRQTRDTECTAVPTP